MTTPTQPTVFSIWPDGSPNTVPGPEPEVDRPPDEAIDVRVIRNISQPTITAFLPDPTIATGTAVIVCPGGAYHFLAVDHEGLDVARWLNARGVAAFMLKYRVVPTHAEDEIFRQQLKDNLSNRVREDPNNLINQQARKGIADGQQAVRIVRQRAAEWGIAPDKIGMLGFSAGAVVTIGVATGYDAESRPDFAAPVYSAPWPFDAVPTDAPPLFLALASDDAMAVGASIPFYKAWREAERSAELHIYAAGGHGFGMLQKGLPSDAWIDRFGEWLVSQGFPMHEELDGVL
jgi:acetyl esterase/lipase